MRNIKLTLEYDGSGYAGWQLQADRPTVQGALEAALSRVTDGPVRTIASGRTDAGVHAFGQVVNFTTASTIDNTSLVRGVNSLLPEDIAVLEAGDVPMDFHARYKAVSKTYRYIILNRDKPSAFYRSYAWHLSCPLDLKAMACAMTFLEGKKDFSSFRAVSSSHRNPVRNIIRTQVRRKGDFILLEFEAESFLQHMVRIMVGTLVEAGRGKIKPEELKGILQARDRSAAGPTATARGLYLVKVEY
jgi:tRNA pseudouridine38-40 synthase